MKATNVVGKKMAGNTCKMAISYLCHFRFETEFIIGQLFSMLRENVKHCTDFETENIPDWPPLIPKLL